MIRFDQRKFSSAVTQRERLTRDQRDICESLVRLELKRLERESLRYWAKPSP